MAAVLVLCALLLSNEVMSEDGDDATAAPTAGASDATQAADAAAASDAVSSSGAGVAPTAAAGEGSASSAAPQDSSFTVITVSSGVSPDSKDGDTSGTSGTTPAPIGRINVDGPVVAIDDSLTVKVVPRVRCVGEGEISENSGVEVEVATSDCEESKNIIQGNPAKWCNKQECELKIFQKDKTMLVASEDAKLTALSETLQSEPLKTRLGVTKVETPSSSSSGSSVFVGILVSGLLAALGITIGYFKCQRRADTKGVRLAEEAYPVDQDNQGNTLVSVAPLNPPAETPEKPSVNGESPEAAKTQPPPPTNGHSANTTATTKTADTEL